MPATASPQSMRVTPVERRIQILPTCLLIFLGSIYLEGYTHTHIVDYIRTLPFISCAMLPLPAISCFSSNPPYSLPLHYVGGWVEQAALAEDEEDEDERRRSAVFPTKYFPGGPLESSISHLPEYQPREPPEAPPSPSPAPTTSSVACPQDIVGWPAAAATTAAAIAIDSTAAVVAADENDYDVRTFPAPTHDGYAEPFMLAPPPRPAMKRSEISAETLLARPQQQPLTVPGGTSEPLMLAPPPPLPPRRGSGGSSELPFSLLDADVGSVDCTTTHTSRSRLGSIGEAEVVSGGIGGGGGGGDGDGLVIKTAGSVPTFLTQQSAPDVVSISASNVDDAVDIHTAKSLVRHPVACCRTSLRCSSRRSHACTF